MKISYDQPAENLIHFTSTADVITSICENGFLLIPNDRELFRVFLSDEIFNTQDPQYFGMVCFTELKLHEIAQHAAAYGQFGICVRNEWAQMHSVDRVFYIRPDGPVFSVLKWLFETAKIDLDNRIKYPDDGVWTNSYFNANIAQAVAGGHLYGLLLHLYEFMQPSKSAAEREWRIVQKSPVQFSSKDRKEMIKEALAAAKTWATYSVQIKPDDVRFFVCKRGDERALKRALPNEFRAVPIKSYPRRSWMPWRVLHSLADLLNKASTERMSGAPFRQFPAYRLRPSSASGPVSPLPQVGRVQGAVLEALATPQQSRVTVQYTDLDDKWHQLDAPFLDAMYLLNVLRKIEEETGFRADPTRR